MKPPSRMEFLKYSTEDQHAGIERALNLQDPAFTLASYVRLLQRFHGYYSPWEQIYGPALDRIAPGFFAERLKSSLLQEDLAVLGCPGVDALPRCTRVPALFSEAQALGSMYVVEGSTLGGRLLSRHFADLLDVRPGTGGRFFAGYGERTGVKWREFAALVEARLDSGSAAEAAAGAQATFQTLSDWLVEPPAPGPADSRCKSESRRP